MKICTKCKVEKEENQFRLNKRSKDGLDYNCKQCYLEYNKKWSKTSAAQKSYENKLNKAKGDRKINPLKYKSYDKQYYQRNRSKVIKRTTEYNTKKYKNDTQYKICSLLRSRILHALKNYKGVKKASKTLELIGCTIEELKLHLESQFTEGMSWDNQGGWHIDHIIPCANFDFNDPNQQKICFHYTNLQPLWAKDNQSKGSKSGS